MSDKMLKKDDQCTNDDSKDFGSPRETVYVRTGYNRKFIKSLSNGVRRGKSASSRTRIRVKCKSKKKPNSKKNNI